MCHMRHSPSCHEEQALTKPVELTSLTFFAHAPYNLASFSAYPSGLACYGASTNNTRPPTLIFIAKHHTTAHISPATLTHLHRHLIGTHGGQACSRTGEELVTNMHKLSFCLIPLMNVVPVCISFKAGCMRCSSSAWGKTVLM